MANRGFRSPRLTLFAEVTTALNGHLVLVLRTVPNPWKSNLHADHMAREVAFDRDEFEPPLWVRTRVRLFGRGSGIRSNWV